MLHGIFCTFSWIALSFLDTKRGMTEATAGHVRGGLKRRKKKKNVKKEAAAEDLRGEEDHAETLWALIVLHIF